MKLILPSNKSTPVNKSTLRQIQSAFSSNFFKKKILISLFIYLLIIFGCAGSSLLLRLSLVEASGGYSLLVVCGLLVAVASLVVGQRLLVAVASLVVGQRL